MTTFREWFDDLAERLYGGLRPALDPERRKSELDEKMAPFGPEGPWAHVAAPIRLASQTRAIEAMDRRAGIALYHVEIFLREHTEVIAAAVERTKRAPDPADGENGADPMLTRIYAEMIRARLEPKLRSAAHSARQQAYVEADENTVEGKTVIALVEEMRTSGPPTTDPRELAAAEALKRQIERRQDERVPAEARELLTLMADAKREAGRAQQVHKIQPVRPPEDV